MDKKKPRRTKLRRRPIAKRPEARRRPAARGTRSPRPQKLTADRRRVQHARRRPRLQSATLFGIARTLLRAAEELPKPNGERLREFGESDLDRSNSQLFSDEPIYDDFETLKLADCADLPGRATRLRTTPIVQKVLAGKSPRRAGRRADQRHEAQGRRRAQEAVRGRQAGGRRGRTTR